MRKRFAIFTAVLMLLFSAGCGSAPVVVHEIPAPVETQKNTIPEALMVLPLSGLTPRIGIAMGMRTAWGLKQAGYPARHVTVSDGVSPVLTGWIEELSVSNDLVWLNISWAAYGGDGVLLGKFTQKASVTRSGWDRLSTETLGVVVMEAIPGINDLIRGEMFPPGSQMEPKSVSLSDMSEILPGREATIIVSGEGIAKLDDSGRKVWEPLVKVTAQPQTTVVDLQNPQEPVHLIDPSTRQKPVEAYISEGLTEEYESAMDTELPSMAEIADLPPRDPESPTPTVIMEVPEAPDDVDALTPEKAALVSTTPEVTMRASEPEPAAISATSAFTPTMYRPVFLVRQAAGATGDGNLALRDAMRKALRQNDAMLSDDLSQVSHIIQATVRVEVPFAGRQRVRIVWIVTNTAGLEMGSALQENDVPEGSLAQSWASVAQPIADAAVLGIAQLFDAGLDAGGISGQLSQPDLPHLQ